MIPVDAFVIALKTVFDRARAGGRPLVIELRFDDQAFRATVADARLEIIRGSAEHPDARLAGDAATAEPARRVERRRKETTVRRPLNFNCSPRWLGFHPEPI